MALRRFAQLTAVSTFLLLLAGGLVTSTDSGLSVPDWPLSFGTLFPPMVGGVRFEHTHRLLAAGVALMITVLAVWIGRTESRRWVRWCGYGALVGVLAQALLGGLTVLWRLPHAVSVAHACLAQVVFCLVTSLALVMSPSWLGSHSPHETVRLRKLPRWCGLTTAVIFMQLVLGAMVRHGNRAVVFHIVNALVVAGLVGWVAWQLLRPHASPWPRLLRWSGVGMVVGCLVQLVLGPIALFQMDHVVITTTHLAIGALLLVSAYVSTLTAFHAARTVPAMHSPVATAPVSTTN